MNKIFEMVDDYLLERSIRKEREKKSVTQLMIDDEPWLARDLLLSILQQNMFCYMDPKYHEDSEHLDDVIVIDNDVEYILRNEYPEKAKEIKELVDAYKSEIRKAYNAYKEAGRTEEAWKAYINSFDNKAFINSLLEILES